MTKVLLKLYDGVGGPEKRFLAPDGFWAEPTKSGDYRVAYCGRHRSRRYPAWSSIPWGTQLRDSGTDVSAFVDGKWQSVSSIAKVTRDQLIDYQESLYGRRTVPATWMFNDFGHMTCYIF